jgi:hypothetical protein
MMRYIIISYLALVSHSSICQIKKVCNQECRLNSFTSKVPIDFCLPEGFWITQVIDTVDLTADTRNDLILKWRKKSISEGDTIWTTIFSMNADSSFTEHATCNNLYTPMFTDYTKQFKTGNLQLDSIYMKFVYSNYSLVEFTKNTIKVGFFTDAGGGIDLHFTYDRNSSDWLLTRKRYWIYENRIVGKQFASETIVKEKMCIKQLRIIDFID